MLSAWQQDDMASLDSAIADLIAAKHTALHESEGERWEILCEVAGVLRLWTRGQGDDADLKASIVVLRHLSEAKMLSAGLRSGTHAYGRRGEWSPVSKPLH
jgi:hypothetical protein